MRIIVHSVTTLKMSGAWILSDSLIPTILHDSFPNLREISLLGCNGFTLPALTNYLQTTQDKRSFFLKVLLSILEPTQEEKKELGMLRRKGVDGGIGGLED